MEDEGLFIPLQVSLSTLKESLNNAFSLINSAIDKAMLDMGKIGENVNLSTLNTKLKEEKTLLDGVEQSTKQANEEMGKTTGEPVKKVNDKLKDTKTGVDALASKFQAFFGFDINKILSKAGLSLTDITKMFTSPAGLIAAVGLATKAMLKLGKEFDEAYSSIAKGTGATGKQLEGLKQSLLNIGTAGVEQSMGEVGKALAEINTRFGLAGQAAEDMTRVFADFADVTNQDITASVASASELVNKWGIDISETGDILDKLTLAGQTSGISVGTLTSQLTDAAAQFQSAGFSIDESIAMLASFEKAGIKTENVMTGLNKAIAYFSERGVEAGEGIDQLIKSIQEAESETAALSMATEVFGMRSGVELAKAIRSGKFSLDEYTESIKNAAGTVEKTDIASKTLGDRLATLGNILKSTFAPVFGFITGIANGILDLLIPAISRSDKTTKDLNRAEADLKTNTDALKASVKEYDTVNKELNTNTKTLNATELQTLNTRKEIAALNITTNLTKTIRALEDTDKQYDKQVAKTEEYRGKIIQIRNDLLKSSERIAKREKEIQEIMDGDVKGRLYELQEAKTRLDLEKNIYDTLNASLIKNEDLLSSAESTLKNANKTRSEEITLMAEFVAIGAIQISAIETRNKEIAKEVTIRSEQIKNDKLVAEYSEKLAAGLIKESDLNTLNNKELIKRIKTEADIIRSKQLLNKETENGLALSTDKEERDKINAENEKRLLTNRIAILNMERNAEIEAAKKVGADVSKINLIYDRMIQEERLKFEEQFAMKLMSNKLEQLEAEKQAKLKEAKEIGANTVLLEKFYDEEIQKEKERMAQEEILENQKKLNELKSASQSYYATEIDLLRERASAEIDAIAASGGNVRDAMMYWNNQILQAQLKLDEERAASNKAANDKIAADNAAAAKKTMSDIETIIAGSIELIGLLDKQTADVLKKLADTALNVVKIIQSGGADIGAWVGAIVGGIDLIITAAKSLARWWDVNIIKIDKMTEYAKYVFKEMKESFEADIGQAFESAFEDGINVDDLKKIVGKKIMKVAIDAALFSAGLNDRLEKIGDLVSKAIKNGFDKNTLAEINKQIEAVYDTTTKILDPLAEKINSAFGLIEKEIVVKMGSFADYVNMKWKEASESFTSSLSSTFIQAFTDGFDLTELRKRIGEQLLQVAVESALFTIGFQDKMEALGQLVADAINSGFTQRSLDAISAQVNQIYQEAATVISPIASLIGSTFGTGAKENFGQVTNITTNTEELQTGLVINQEININNPTESPIDVRRAAEEGARQAMLESGLTA